jgi:Putative prokaryotic signal transducing protein
MKKVYVALNLPDAHIALNLLTQVGIDAYVFNANAQSGIGEIPFTEAYPQVWVMDDEQCLRAKKIVREYILAPTDHRVVYCEKCNEENPLNFGVCWNCGFALTHAQ